MGTKARKARAKFDKLAALNSAPDKGAARKEKLRMADTWTNRGNSTGDYHKPGNLSNGALLANRNRSHLVTSL